MPLSLKAQKAVQGKTKSVQSYVPESLADWLAQQSHRTGMSQSQYLERLISDHAKQHGYVEPLPFDPSKTQELAAQIVAANPNIAAQLLADLGAAMNKARCWAGCWLIG